MSGVRRPSFPPLEQGVIDTIVERFHARVAELQEKLAPCLILKQNIEREYGIAMEWDGILSGAGGEAPRATHEGQVTDPTDANRTPRRLPRRAFKKALAGLIEAIPADGWLLADMCAHAVAQGILDPAQVERARMSNYLANCAGRGLLRVSREQRKNRTVRRYYPASPSQERGASQETAAPASPIAGVAIPPKKPSPICLAVLRGIKNLPKKSRRTASAIRAKLLHDGFDLAQHSKNIVHSTLSRLVTQGYLTTEGEKGAWNNPRQYALAPHGQRVLAREGRVTRVKGRRKS